MQGSDHARARDLPKPILIPKKGMENRSISGTAERKKSPSVSVTAQAVEARPVVPQGIEGSAQNSTRIPGSQEREISRIPGSPRRDMMLRITAPILTARRRSPGHGGTKRSVFEGTPAWKLISSRSRGISRSKGDPRAAPSGAVAPGAAVARRVFGPWLSSGLRPFFARRSLVACGRAPRWRAFGLRPFSVGGACRSLVASSGGFRARFFCIWAGRCPAPVEGKHGRKRIT